jgi:hypothetical protein
MASLNVSAGAAPGIALLRLSRRGATKILTKLAACFKSLRSALKVNFLGSTGSKSSGMQSSVIPAGSLARSQSQERLNTGESRNLLSENLQRFSKAYGITTDDGSLVSMPLQAVPPLKPPRMTSETEVKISMENIADASEYAVVLQAGTPLQVSSKTESGKVDSGRFVLPPLPKELLPGEKLPGMEGFEHQPVSREVLAWRRELQEKVDGRAKTISAKVQPEEHIYATVMRSGPKLKSKTQGEPTLVDAWRSQASEAPPPVPERTYLRHESVPPLGKAPEADLTWAELMEESGPEFKGPGFKLTPDQKSEYHLLAEASKTSEPISTAIDGVVTRTRQTRTDRLKRTTEHLDRVRVSSGSDPWPSTETELPGSTPSSMEGLTEKQMRDRWIALEIELAESRRSSVGATEKACQFDIVFGGTKSQVKSVLQSGLTVRALGGDVTPRQPRSKPMAVGVQFKQPKLAKGSQGGEVGRLVQFFNARPLR